jgi:hypothetical protein
MTIGNSNGKTIIDTSDVKKVFLEYIMVMANTPTNIPIAIAKFLKLVISTVYTKDIYANISTTIKKAGLNMDTHLFVHLF